MDSLSIPLPAHLPLPRPLTALPCVIGGGCLRTCVLRPPGIYGPEEQRHLPRVAVRCSSLRPEARGEPGWNCVNDDPWSPCQSWVSPQRGTLGSGRTPAPTRPTRNRVLGGTPARPDTHREDVELQPQRGRRNCCPAQMWAP